MKNVLILLIAFILTINYSIGQEINVQGKVTSSEDNYPLPGVNIVIKGTTDGTITDLDGNYELTVSSDASLVYSFIGYEDKEIQVKGRTEINVKLDVKAQELEETVVIGYGVVKKKDLTGSIEVVESEDIESIPIMTSEQVLQGKASGVFVATSNGSPGSPISVRIRGVGTPNNTDPLYIVDGMPIKDASFGKNDNPSGINFLNPSDIESIQVLKDASATAIYGTRGANGVVIITTKKGKSGDMRIKFNGYYGLQKIPKKLDLLNAQQFATLYNEANGVVFKEDTIPLLQTTDWQDEIFTLAPTYNAQVSVSGGNEKSNFYLSANHNNQDGIIKNSSFMRNSLRLNSEHKVNKWLRIGEFLTLSNYTNERQKEQGLGANGTTGSCIAGALMADPTVPVYDSDGHWNYLSRTIKAANPVGINERHNYTYDMNRIQGSAYAEISFLQNFMYKLNAGLDRSWGFRKEVWPKYYVGPTDASDRTTLITEHEDWYNYLLENTITYNNTFLGNHTVNILAGYTIQEEIRNREIASSKLDTDNEDMYYHSARASITDVSDLGGSPIEWAIMSWLGRINYNYKDKYLITASLRRDGSSRFGSNNRWGNFPSLALAWKINEEPFMEKYDMISSLKFRAGWGRVGNQNINPYAYTATATFKPDAGLPGPNAFFGTPVRPAPALFIIGVANQNIGWETTETTNLGLDISLWNDKLNASIDVYNKTTKDLLLSKPVPAYAAVTYGSFITNAGEINNKGLDFTTTYKGSTGSFTYDISGNFSTFINKVVELEGGAPLTSQTDFPVRMIEDRPIGAFYGYVHEGIFESDEEIAQHAYQEKGTDVGDLKFKDLNQDGLITDQDQTIIGYALPDFTYGVTLGLSYKSFDLNVFSQGVYGNSVANNVKRQALHNLDLTTNVSTDLLDYYGRELPDGTIVKSDIPRIGRDYNNNTRVSNYYLEDGSYFRIKTLTLSYNVPSAASKKLFMSGIRIYGTIQNLHTFTKYSGYNPEIGVSSAFNANPLAFGIDNAVYPLPRTYMLGLDISF